MLDGVMMCVIANHDTLSFLFWGGPDQGELAYPVHRMALSFHLPAPATVLPRAPALHGRAVSQCRLPR